ncbi:MAG: SIS domain-containing protein [Verrucomicrobiota bacterium]
MKTRPSCDHYAESLARALQDADWTPVEKLAEILEEARTSRKQVFLCGNGGSAANALHIANDLTAAIYKGSRNAIRTHALTANVATLSCISNDLSYETGFSQQLRVLAEPGDLLIVLSGSGNSPNIIEAIREAKELGVTSIAILGFDGGKALSLADHPIHFQLDDMQVVEDLQLVVGHMIMKALSGSSVD